MGKKSTPDYKGAAEETARSDAEMLDKQTQANRPNQYNPWGSMEWAQDADGNWSQTQTLTDDAQSALDAQMAMQKGKSEQGLGMMDRMKNEFGESMDFSKYGEQTGLEFDPSQLRQRAEDASYNRATSRLDPRFEQDANKLEIDLANKGLSPGDAAYDSAMGNFNRSKEDAYSNARNQSVQQGKGESAQDFQQQKGSADYSNQLRQNAMKEEMQQRGMSLNEINAIMSGQQVQTPGFEGFNQAGKSKGVDYSGALQSGSDFDQAQGQMLMSGIGSAAGMMGCDRRLKENIKRIGTVKGFPFYIFTYLSGQRSVGWMADEVNSSAVSTHESGYQMINPNNVNPLEA
jgi:hypothetical protein